MMPAHHKTGSATTTAAASVTAEGPVAAVEEAQGFCTYAVSGPYPIFQTIFVCHTCSPSQDALCLCQACADTCHADHDGLEYIGMGPSYCDCQTLSSSSSSDCGCQIKQSSAAEALRLGIPPAHIHELDQSRRDQLHPSPNQGARSIPSSLTDTVAAELDILDPSLCDSLCRQAITLVQHSRETFWLEDDASDQQLCDLERLALMILRRHMSYYSLSRCAAEWWVQVKSVSYNYDLPNPGTDESAAEAVDLHYDKDEALAESFGLGVFPTLSTVTYLTDSSSSAIPAPPTVILSRTYDTPDEMGVSQLLVSQPRRGKHLVFDGRLLHGAPYHLALRQVPHEQPAVDKPVNQDRPPVDQWRITILVNLWIGHHPANVHALPNDIRRSIIKSAAAFTGVSSDSGDAAAITTDRNALVVGAAFRELLIAELEWTADNVAELGIHEAGTDKGYYYTRVELPFVGTATTWGKRHDRSTRVADHAAEEDDEEEAALSLVVSTYIPPMISQDTSYDTCLVHFSKDVEAYVDAPTSDS